MSTMVSACQGLCQSQYPTTRKAEKISADSPERTITRGFSGGYARAQTGITDGKANEIQSITLEAGQTMHLGTLGGKPYDVEIYPRGGVGWTGQRLHYHPDPDHMILTPELIRESHEADGYSRAELQQGAMESGIIHHLYWITKDNYKADDFNDYLKQLSIPEECVTDALNRLGIDTGEPFAVNGRMFTWSGGSLKDYTALDTSR